MRNLYKYMGMKSVKSIEDRLFAVIQKIMNESIEASYISQYDYFNKLKNISNKLIAVLDDGDYIDNAKVIRDLDTLIYKYEIFTIIPNLVNKHIVSIHSDQNSFWKFINESFEDCLNYDISMNIPYIILPYCESFCTNSVYILSYCNKIVELTIDEYKLICTDLYKYNIDIKKIIKCFFSYQSKITTNTCFVYFPLDMDIENTVYCRLKDKITVSVFIGNEIFNREFFKNKLYYNSFYFLGSKSEYKKFLHVYKSKYIKCISYKNLIDRIKRFDNIFYNYNINQEIDLLLLEVKNFYINSLSRLNNILKGLKTDLLRIQDDKLKEQLQYYYEYKQIEYDELSISKNKFCNFYSEILNYILNNGLSNEYYDITLLNLENQFEVINLLIRKFFICSNVKDIEEMHNIILQLKKANFDYTEIFEIYLKYLNQDVLSKEELYLVANVKNIYFNSKIKIAMSSVLNLSESELIELVSFIDNVESGKELYYLGLSLFNRKNYKKSILMLFRALKLEYHVAGIKLLEISEQIHQSNIRVGKWTNNKIKELISDYLDPQTCFKLALENLNEKSSKANIFLKISISKGYLPAVEFLAYQLYDKCKMLDNKSMEKDDNRIAASNAIDFFCMLSQIKKDNDYSLEIGLLHYRLGNYPISLKLLRKCQSDIATYYIAMMYLNGLGISKNIKKSRDLFFKIRHYRDSNDWYLELNKIIKKEEKRKDSYNSSKSYNRKIDVEDYHDSWCFISTATCIALKKTSNCDELNLLRRFRDTYLKCFDKDGLKLINEYYRIAPTIVNHIDEEELSNQIYINLYQHYISKCCFYIKNYRFNDAKALYIEMVASLCEIYNIRISPDIKKIYNYNN